MYSERQYLTEKLKSIGEYKILSASELEIWNQWHDLGVAYAKKKSSPTKEQEELMNDYPDLSWCFELGFRATLYHDTGPRTMLGC